MKPGNNVNILKFGEHGSGLKTKGEPQDFHKLRGRCLQERKLYEDPEFPATDSSLTFSGKNVRWCEWKRPSEIVDKPQLFVDSFSRFDVRQGKLADCWVLAAVANLTLYRHLFLQIVPHDQGFDKNYAGIFHFRFWQYGHWIDVVIDDKLPTWKDELVYTHSTEPHEFWSALLEKAYAKVHGSYEALIDGSTCEAMEDFTGGVTEIYKMAARPPNLLQIILQAYERSSLLGCITEPDPKVKEAKTPEGLVRGHAYSITRVKYVNITKPGQETPNKSKKIFKKAPITFEKILLLRLRNPWGNEFEWNGAWSDNAPEWRSISDKEKKELGLVFDHDGEFWMSFSDFQKYFSRLEICNLSPDSLSDKELTDGRSKKWQMSAFEGEWVCGVTAGGCYNFLRTFWHNPQYLITLTEVDESDDEGKCTLILGLMQKHRRHAQHGGAKFLTIGFVIYHLPFPDSVSKPLRFRFFKDNDPVATSPFFIDLREVSCRLKLSPGTYCIVPSTFDPNEEGEFLLRVFSERRNNIVENDEAVGVGAVDQRALEVERTPVQIERDVETKELFTELVGEYGKISWVELKEILDHYMKKEVNDQGVSKDLCRSMISMLDQDHTGKLNLQEFQTLWTSIRTWKNVFKLYDVDSSGTLSNFELREAINSAGYTVNNHILNILMHRYGNKKGELDFDDFILCAIKLKTMIDLFREKDKAKTNGAFFTLEEWLENTLCC